MKSIMEEASSVSKAIEKGWIEAGKPQEFSVKVFEEATKNFLGITTKPAKIAIFYDEKVMHQQPKQQQRQPRPQRTEYPKPAHAHPERERTESRRPQQQAARPERTHQRPLPQQNQQEGAQPQERRNKDVWTPEMVDAVSAWVKETLTFMGASSKSFSTDVKNYYLKITFDNPIFEDREKERTVFRSFAHLLMQSLRNKFKKGLRGYKVILDSPANNQ